MSIPFPTLKQNVLKGTR